MRRLFTKQAVVTPFENGTNTNEEEDGFRRQPYEYYGSNEDVDWQHVRVSQPSSNRQNERFNQNVNPHLASQRAIQTTYPAYEEVHSGTKEDVKRRTKSREAKRQNSVGHAKQHSNLSNAKIRNSKSYYGDTSSDPALLDYRMQDQQGAAYTGNRLEHARDTAFGHQSNPQQFEQIRYPDGMPNPHDARKENDLHSQHREASAAFARSHPVQTRHSGMVEPGFSHPQASSDDRYLSNRPPNTIPVERSQDRYVDRSDDKNDNLPSREGKGKMKNWLVGLAKKGEMKRVNDKYQTGWEGQDSQESLQYDRNEQNNTDSQPTLPSSGRASPTKRKAEMQSSAWRDWKGIAKAKEKVEEGIITQQIGWLCAQDERFWEQDHLIPLVSAISHSEAASKEAAKALRKEFKMGSESAQFGSVKLMAILYLRTGDRFRLQMANKRFLETIEDVYADKHTSSKMRGRLLVVWSMLAHRSRLDADLQPITKMFNRIKPVDMPVDGTPLDEQNDLFHTQDEAVIDPILVTKQENPQDNRSRSQPEMPPRAPNAEEQITMQSSLDNHFAAVRQSQSEAEQYAQFAAQQAEDMQRLREESNVARGNAQLLAETLIEDGLEAPLLGEFLEKTKLSHDFISQQIPWASAQAEQARNMREGLESEDQTMTEEEKLLEDLLDAHEKITNAQSMVEEAQLRRQEDEEEAQILNRSMREMRMDRNALVTDPETGHVYHYDGSHLSHTSASGSRSVSPSPMHSASMNTAVPASKNGFLAPPMQPSKSAQSAPDPVHLQFIQQDLNRSATTNSAPTPAFTHSRDNSLSGSGTLAGPRPMQINSPKKKSMGLPMSSYDKPSNNNEEDESVDVTTPIVPSEKALGKRRAISIRENSPIEDQSHFGSFNAASSNGQQDRSVAKGDEREGSLLARPPPALPS